MPSKPEPVKPVIMTTAATRAVKNADLLKAEFKRNSNAAIGVYIVRTRHLVRAAPTLQDISVEKVTQFRMWTCNKGWQNFPDPSAGLTENTDLSKPVGEPVPKTLEVALPEYNETLRPSYAVPEFDKAPGGEPRWLMLVQRGELGRDPDEAPETGDKDRLGEMVLGCNPLLRPVSGTGFQPYYGFGDGVLRLTIGENRESGGANRSSLHRWLMFTDGIVPDEYAWARAASPAEGEFPQASQRMLWPVWLRQIEHEQSTGTGLIEPVLALRSFP